MFQGPGLFFRPGTHFEAAGRDQPQGIPREFVSSTGMAAYWAHCRWVSAASSAAIEAAAGAAGRAPVPVEGSAAFSAAGWGRGAAADGLTPVPSSRDVDRHPQSIAPNAVRRPVEAARTSGT